MMVADESMMVKVVAIDKVAKQILQTTSANIFRLSQLVFLKLQSMVYKHFNQQNERKRKLMLLDYLDNSNIVVNSHSSVQDISPSSSNASEKGKVAEILHSPFSPLKRQLSEITFFADIYTSTSKKNLSIAESDDANESSNSKA
ncbi:hypothetical protein LIER_38550 [Lithospermum erythrorhizon]|uniref:Uncharacterized protein n=1 Tax=Lithospermum erythrorhizon TaxID=34254 RepID=A0AAV3Q6U1_LITER